MKTFLNLGDYEFNLDVDEIVIFKSRMDKNEGTILLEKYKTLSR